MGKILAGVVFRGLMHDLYIDYWQSLRSRSHLRVPLFLSLIAHATAVAFVAKTVLQPPPPPPISITYEVQILNAPAPEPEPVKKPPPPPEPEPKPKPKPPPPKPKPPPPPEPKPELVAKKVEKKPEP
ncbi:MAG: hypothetical protein QGD90_11710, partial [Candidatus Hydrogenedentes bacterium]|nr:hypothetical protein [Candidatus Hydrogenedentota bacterium]